MNRDTVRRAADALSPAPPLLETKLRPPRARTGVVVRQRLLDQLDGSWSAALTLVTAPVGFGKTILVQSWAETTDAACAWVSLDAGDDDPTRLWTYVATSVDRIRPGLGRIALARLRSSGVPPEVVVDELLNGINAYGRPLAIVLDDVHVLTDESCRRSLEHAVEHLPSHARLVATARSDPLLALGRLRARGALGEIRMQDLAFTHDEARELLVQRAGVALDETDVALLGEQTEGWPAGMYLAALWLRELADPKAGVKRFGGDHRHVVDYLTGEVLDNLSDDVRRLMLETSTLGTFSASMCDAVLGRSDSAQRLRELERKNGFLIALDGHGEWYRYHQLFGELLQLELANREPGTASRLRVAASEWCRREGRLEDALEHAAAANDFRLVASILASEHRTLLLSGRLTTALRWCSTLSEEALLEHPELPLTAGLSAGLLGRSASLRRGFVVVAERARSERPEQWTAYHEAALGIVRTTWVESDLGETIEVACAGIEVARSVPEAAVSALAALSFLLFLSGQRSEARAFADEALARPEAAARPHGLIVALSTVSLLDADAGRAGLAEQRARYALAAATDSGVDHSTSDGAARIALAVALAAQHKLREAEREAVRGESLRRGTEPEIGHLHALLVLAGIRAGRGEIGRAAAGLDEARAGLEAFGDAGRLPELAAALATTLQGKRTAAAMPVEPPSAAEARVLELLATDLSRREIGARLFLSSNTVKTHTRSLYKKLGAASRAEAVERATTLGLLRS